jgi:hypothetical protein
VDTNAQKAIARRARLRPCWLTFSPASFALGCAESSELVVASKGSAAALTHESVYGVPDCRVVQAADACAAEDCLVQDSSAHALLVRFR